ncbi:MAG TPA: type II toxin-antitoxin system RelE/ParE family toxin [Spirochaetota bacterium]|nr:type II toxin-antitoxin system RelE/ParE family toxin [Spirochaetota bacterium]HPU89961.1 type II toxin-antitoxin system RelE/ParE family toxin [Spirochaetota bacterium]
MKQVLFHPVAEAEMAESALWYENKQKNLGKRFLEAVESALKRIQIQPELYRVLENDIRMCGVGRFPYGIIFREKERSIEVIAIMHLKRKPGFWKERV